MRFAICTILPVFLIVTALLVGGIWPWLALGYMTGFVFLMDLIKTPKSLTEPSEFPASLVLARVLAMLHFGVLVLAIATLGQASDLSLTEKVVCFLSVGLFFGLISNSNAHELIHRPARFDRDLGALVFSSMLYGYHATSHLLVHHPMVATPGDPNTARKGEGFYRFAIRAARGGVRLGAIAAAKRMQIAGFPRWRHPFVGYCLFGFGVTLAMFNIGGWAGLGWYLGLCFYAEIQLLLSDYVQHYGLRRQKMASGKYEPMGPQHAWDAPRWFSETMMLNATRHGDHHLSPERRFDVLRRAEGDAPTLPASLPVMAAAALFPPIWFRLMDARVEREINRDMARS
jgi:alkane 1-monooxygenase